MNDLGEISEPASSPEDGFFRLIVYSVIFFGVWIYGLISAKKKKIKWEHRDAVFYNGCLFLGVFKALMAVYVWWRFL